MNPDKSKVKTSTIEWDGRKYFLKHNPCQGVGATHSFWFSAWMTQRVQQKKWRDKMIAENEDFNVQEKPKMKLQKLCRSPRLEKMRREEEQKCILKMKKECPTIVDMIESIKWICVIGQNKYNMKINVYDVEQFDIVLALCMFRCSSTISNCLKKIWYLYFCLPQLLPGILLPAIHQNHSISLP